jgi:GMP synthase-like glutamine amidotransferase
MRALVIQHEPDGPAGLFGEHLVNRGIDVTVHVVLDHGTTENHTPFPDPTGFDLIAPLGSVHGVYEDDVIGTWVHREIDMIRQAHEAGVAVFGICFGAQVLAAALGGAVEKSHHYEIGWHHYDSDLPDIVAPGPWFTWHGDRCVLPDGVDEFARNELCPQAFRLGTSVGVQFHPEATPELVGAWAAKCPPEYFAAKGTSVDELLGGFGHHGEAARTQATTLFDWYLDDVIAPLRH